MQHHEVLPGASWRCLGIVRFPRFSQIFVYVFVLQAWESDIRILERFPKTENSCLTPSDFRLITLNISGPFCIEQIKGAVKGKNSTF